MIKPILLDTGVIVALLDRSERNHQNCVNVITNIKRPLITCEAVITESCYLVRNLKGASQAILFNVERNLFQIPWELKENEKFIANLMRKYASVPMDFADACLVCMAEQFNIGEILTLDSDFEIYKWGNKKSFKILTL